MIIAGSDSSTLVLIFKRPVPGSGKQRIAAELGATWTSELAKLLLDAALEDASAWAGPVVLAPANASDADWANGLLDRNARILPQSGSNLGQRIEHLDRELRQRGHERLLYIGSDAPELTNDYYTQACTQLADEDIVLGPATDGGLTLMAANSAWPDLADLPWSTGDLGATLERRCREYGFSVGRLPRQRDVDLREDLFDLTRNLRADPRPARQSLCRWLDESGFGNDA